MMNASKTLLTAGIALSAAFVSASPVFAQQQVSLNADVALVSDYRYRGVSLSDEDPVIQGGLSGGMNGFYVGTWASSIQEFNGAETEFDLYGGWGTQFDNGMAFDVGFLYYAYPGADDANYYELYTSLSGTVQRFDWSVGASYSPDQDNLNDEDNLYLQGDVNYTLPNSPIYVGAHLGYEDGMLGNPNGLGGNVEKLDWSASLGVTWQAWDISVSYVDTDENCGGCDATAVVSVGAAF